MALRESRTGKGRVTHITNANRFEGDTASQMQKQERHQLCARPPPPTPRVCVTRWVRFKEDIGKEGRPGKGNQHQRRLELRPHYELGDLEGLAAGGGQRVLAITRPG